MRLKLILPVVDGATYEKPEECPYGCGGQEFWLRQVVRKPVRDSSYREVVARRYECLDCRRSFRVYPQGVNQRQFSQRAIGLAVMLYVLGLSYGAVALLLEALGLWIGKTTVYEAVQAVAERVPGMKQTQLLEEYRTPALGADLTSVKCNGKWLPLGVTVDALTGLTLRIDRLSGEDAQTLKAWLEPIIETVDARVLVTDDADENGVHHQVCKSHVVRNSDVLIEQLQANLANGSNESLAQIDVSVEQAVRDLQRLKELIHLRQPEARTELETLQQRYQDARSPRKGKSASVAYRLRNLFLDRWNLWPRLTFYRTWQDPIGRKLDGTNNATERTIGWHIKERYRTTPALHRTQCGASVRGYKREQSALNVSRLIAHCGNHLEQGLQLASLMP